MSIFDDALADIYASPIASDALYRAGGVGAGVGVRVIVRRPDQRLAYGDVGIVADTTRLMVRRAAVAAPAEGDTVTIGSEVWKVQGDPAGLDVERLEWTLEVRPV